MGLGTTVYGRGSVPGRTQNEERDRKGEMKKRKKMQKIKGSEEKKSRRETQNNGDKEGAGQHGLSIWWLGNSRDPARRGSTIECKKSVKSPTPHSPAPSPRSPRSCGSGTDALPKHIHEIAWPVDPGPVLSCLSSWLVIAISQDLTVPEFNCQNSRISLWLASTFFDYTPI